MSDPLDEANAQYMAAMGLADVSLGQPYTPEKKSHIVSRDRCPSFLDGEGQCVLLPGHDTSHVRGKARWSDEDAQGVEVVTEPSPDGLVQSCEAAKEGIVHMPHLYTVGEIQHACLGQEETPPQPTKQRPGDQPLPSPGQECVQDLIIAEMEESKRVGLERYGSTLQTFNGRRGIQDIAEEIRDLHVYLAQMRRESEATQEQLTRVVAGVLEKSLGMVFQNEEMRRAVCEEVSGTIVTTLMGWVNGRQQTRDAADRETQVDTVLKHFLDSLDPDYYADYLLGGLTGAAAKRIAEVAVDALRSAS